MSILSTSFPPFFLRSCLSYFCWAAMLRSLQWREFIPELDSKQYWQGVDWTRCRGITAISVPIQILTKLKIVWLQWSRELVLLTMWHEAVASNLVCENKQRLGGKFILFTSGTGCSNAFFGKSGCKAKRKSYWQKLYTFFDVPNYIKWYYFCKYTFCGNFFPTWASILRNLFSLVPVQFVEKFYRTDQWYMQNI